MLNEIMSKLRGDQSDEAWQVAEGDKEERCADWYFTCSSSSPSGCLAETNDFPGVLWDVLGWLSLCHS